MPRAEPAGRPAAAAGAGPGRAWPWVGSLGLHAVLGLAMALSSILTWSMRPAAVHTVEAYVVHGSGAPSRPPAAAPSVPPPADPPPLVKPAAVPPAPAPAPAPAAAASAAHEASQVAARTVARDAELARARAEAAARDAATKAAAAASQRKAEEAAAKARTEAARNEALAREKAELASHQVREADLARQLAAEEHASALSAQQAGLLARYKAELTGRVQRYWIRPPTARAGLRCTVHVTQVPGGTVTSVVISSNCNADPAVRQSIESAVLRASPLPPPPDPSLFDRNLTLEFAPDA